MRHQHWWRDESTTYNPGLDIKSVKGITADELERLSLGITNIKQRCEGCGEVRIVSATGRVQ